MAVNSIAFLNMIESRMARLFMCLLMSEAIEAIVKVKRKKIATSLRIVPWRCESLWHFCMLDTDIMLANKSLAIFKPLAQSQKTMLTTNQRNFFYHASLSFVFKHVVIVDRHEPFSKHHCDYNNSSKSAHFSAFCGFIKLKVLNLRLFYRS